MEAIGSVRPLAIQRFGRPTFDPNCGRRAVRGRRRFGCRRPGPFIGASQGSDVDLLGNLNGVIDFDAKVSNGALNFRMPEQNLNRSEVPCSPVDQHSLRPAQGVRAELSWIEPDAGHPLLDKSCILPGRQAALIIATTGKQELPRLSADCPSRSFTELTHSG